MRHRMNSILCPDDFIPTSSVFPELDAGRIARDLRLEERGAARGAAGLPPTAAGEDFDSIETSVVEAIATLRRHGLENYETNRRLYNERLVRAEGIAKEAKFVVAAARSEFDAMTELRSSQLEEARRNLREISEWRKRYREIHGLDRPAEAFGGWAKAFAILGFLILAGSAFGGLLFWSAGAGGGLAAILISAVSAGGSAALGHLARYVRHRSLPLRLGGLLAFPLWLFSAAALGFWGAHLLEALGKGAEWREATSAAAGFLAGSLRPASVEGWLLVAVCLSLSAAAFVLGWRTDDPYPGYGKLERARAEARIAYETQLQEALEDLLRRRDRGVEDLKDAAEALRCGVAEAEDALFGQGALNGRLTAFLEQCDVAAAHLLSLYRDANRKARASAAPASFEKSHSFAEFPLAPATTSLSAAKDGSERTIALIYEAVQDLQESFEREKNGFYGGDKNASAAPGEPAKKEASSSPSREDAGAAPFSPPADLLSDSPTSAILRLRRPSAHGARALAPVLKDLR